jgi:hypothetical protein
MRRLPTRDDRCRTSMSVTSSSSRCINHRPHACEPSLRDSPATHARAHSSMHGGWAGRDRRPLSGAELAAALYPVDGHRALCACECVFANHGPRSRSAPLPSPEADGPSFLQPAHQAQGGTVRPRPHVVPVARLGRLVGSAAVALEHSARKSCAKAQRSLARQTCASVAARLAAFGRCQPRAVAAGAHAHAVGQRRTVPASAPRPTGSRCTGPHLSHRLSVLRRHATFTRLVLRRHPARAHTWATACTQPLGEHRTGASSSRPRRLRQR